MVKISICRLIPQGPFILLLIKTLEKPYLKTPEIKHYITAPLEGQTFD